MRFIFLLLATAQVAFSQAPPLNESGTYTLKVLGIPAATITLNVGDTVSMAGRRAFTITATAATNAFFSKFYHLRNTYTTTVDAETGLPVRYVKTIRQKSIEQDMEVNYDAARATASYKGAKFDGRQIATLESSHNLFSMIFFLRRQHFHNGQQLAVNLDIETEPWKALIAVEGGEKINVAGRSIDAHRLVFTFLPMTEEKKRKKTDILTRRLVRSTTKLVFWIEAAPPHTFLRVDVDTSPFTTVTELDEMK